MALNRTNHSLLSPSLSLFFKKMDFTRLERVITTQIPDDNGRHDETPPHTWFPPESVEVNTEVTSDLVHALAQSLTSEQRSHCALGHDPVPPHSNQERLLTRKYKFGLALDVRTSELSTLGVSTTSFEEVMAPERLAERQKKWQAMPIELSEERIRARKDKFSGSMT